MTISYSGNFFRLLLRWKGSLWRSVWRELLVYLALFYVVKFFYLFGIDYLSEDSTDREMYSYEEEIGPILEAKRPKESQLQRRKFEALCRMFNDFTKLIPLTFLLGFYVSSVVSRWWRQFESLSWPEDLLSMVCLIVRENDEKSQRRRHAIARYINLSSALVWRDISKKIRLRFPTVRSLVEAGLLTEKEFDVLESLEENNPPTAFINNFMTELKIFRQSLRKLFCYDWVCVPLVYTQVTALATYSFFFFTLFGRQVLHSEVNAGRQIDSIVPLFAVFQFMFLVGWFKVGQDLMRPFGLDDDDIELNYILDRNFKTSFAVVNRLHTTDFELEEDRIWKNREGKLEPLPHSPYSRRLAEHRPKLHSFVRVGDTDEKTSLNCTGGTRAKK
ncbi:Bestrophin [Teladorsagia circumcincta]|uniref:Bestrophin homolog n=1 Tax=Teladorsagia circumcincta TaxID=45464 RepID=A0A2G9UEC8_TELCI|nr:Bestrophin [Teladorsagia circumcincta]